MLDFNKVFDIVKYEYTEEKEYGDYIYSTGDESISINEDVIAPSIRINFYKNFKEDVGVYDGVILIPVTYREKPISSRFREEGLYMVKTITYKKMSRVEVERLIKYYEELRDNDSRKIAEIIAKQVDNYFNYKVTIREIDFISKDDLMHFGVLNFSNYIIRYGSMYDDNDDVITGDMKFVSVTNDNISKERVYTLNIEGNQIDIPQFFRDELKKDVEEGVYLATNKKLIKLPYANILSYKAINEAWKAVKKELEDSGRRIIEDMIDVRKTIINMVFQKHKIVYDIIKQREELKAMYTLNEQKKELEEIKLNSTVSKANLELEVAARKAELTEYQSMSSFVTSLFKMLGIL